MSSLRAARSHCRYPQLVRPFRVPLPTWGCLLMVTPASALLAVMVLAPAVQGDTLVVTFTCLVCLAEVLLFPLLRAARCRGWCRFAGMSPLAFKVGGAPQLPARLPTRPPACLLAWVPGPAPASPALPDGLRLDRHRMPAPQELLYTMAPIDHPTHAHAPGASEQDAALLSTRSTNDLEGSSAVR